MLSSTLPKKSKSRKAKNVSISEPMAVDAPIQARYEGNDEDLAYEPPRGAIEFEFAEEDTEFEWGSIKGNEDVEVWLVRVPESLSLKHLENVRIAPPNAEASSSRHLGTISRKHHSYDVSQLPEAEEDGESGAGEMHSLTCLFPRAKKGGTLHLTPKSISHRLVITPSHPIPSAPTNSASPTATGQNPPRFSYPPEMLKHRWVPFGSTTPLLYPDGDGMEVEVKEGASTAPAQSPEVEGLAEVAATPSGKKSKKDKSSKSEQKDRDGKEGKKRKVEDGESPKKGKKHKANPPEVES